MPQQHTLDGSCCQSYLPHMTLLTRLLTRYWGYLALVIAALGFFLHSLGFAVILVLSLAAFGYFLLQAPVWCCAVTRKSELCRKNSHGLLLGCSIRQHKWQRMRHRDPAKSFMRPEAALASAAGRGRGGGWRRRC